MAARWYVVHVYSGFESKVAQSIREQAQQTGLDDMIQEVLVPMEEVVQMRRGAKVSAERKFFPGYVLVRMDMTDEAWHRGGQQAVAHIRRRGAAHSAPGSGGCRKAEAVGDLRDR